MMKILGALLFAIIFVALWSGYYYLTRGHWPDDDLSFALSIMAGSIAWLLVDDD